MTSPFDSDQLLRSANPVDETRLFAPPESASAQRLFEKITGIAYQPALPPPHRRRWRAYVTSALAAVVIGGGVAYAVTYRQPTRRLDVGCYAQASMHGTVLALPSHGSDPVAACRKAWIAGQVGPGGPPPDLVACVLSSGHAGVFPARGPQDDVCGRLGLAPVGSPATGSPSTSIPAVFALRDLVVTALRRTCLSGPQAVDLVQSELRRTGLTGWTVTITTPFTPARPCASPGFDEPAQRVLIIPVPPSNEG